VKKFRITRQIVESGLVISLITVLFICPGFTKSSAANQQAATITSDNVSQLELGYVLPGYCGSFSPDEQYIHTLNGIYDVSTGQRSPLPHSMPMQFSPDSKLIAVFGEGVYEIDSGKFRFPISVNGTFSPDSSAIAVELDGVYDVKTGKLLLSSSGIGIFSPDSKLIAEAQDGVYVVATGERLFPITDWGHFSPDGKYIAVAHDGVYEVETGQRLFATPGIYGGPIFSPDGTSLVVADEGVYEVPSGHRRFALSRVYYPVFSPDGKLIAASMDGIYDARTGERIFEIQNTSTVLDFSSDGSLISIEDEGIYDATGKKLSSIFGRFSPSNDFLTRTIRVGPVQEPACIIYSISGHHWPYRSGMVRAKDDSITLLSKSPDGEYSSTASGELPVFARTSDNKWFEVILTDHYQSWVSASDVEIISMPEGIPIETLQ
jgi:WD40 repeat protein